MLLSIVMEYSNRFILSAKSILKVLSFKQNRGKQGSVLFKILVEGSFRFCVNSSIIISMVKLFGVSQVYRIKQRNFWRSNMQYGKEWISCSKVPDA